MEQEIEPPDPSWIIFEEKEPREVPLEKKFPNSTFLSELKPAKVTSSIESYIYCGVASYHSFYFGVITRVNQCNV